MNILINIAVFVAGVVIGGIAAFAAFSEDEEKYYWQDSLCTVRQEDNKYVCNECGNKSKKVGNYCSNCGRRIANG